MKLHLDSTASLIGPRPSKLDENSVSRKLIEVKFPSLKDYEANVSSVCPSSERREGLWIVCSYIAGGNAIQIV